MDMIAVEDTVGALLNNRGVWRATKFLSARYIVRATRVRTKSGTIVLSIGRPNCHEAKFIKRMRKDGIKFPISEVQLRILPKPKKKKKK